MGVGRRLKRRMEGPRGNCTIKKRAIKGKKGKKKKKTDKPHKAWGKKGYLARDYKVGNDNSVERSAGGSGSGDGAWIHNRLGQNP